MSTPPTVRRSPPTCRRRQTDHSPMDVVTRLLELGGVARRSELVGSAADRRALAEAVALETLRDLGGGWVAAVDADAAVVAARRFNGTITCVSAAPFYALQQLRVPERVHMAVPRARGARPVPLRRAVVVHRETSWTRPSGRVPPVAPLVEVLARVLRCCPEDEAVTVVDSALNRGLITVEEIDRSLEGPAVSGHGRRSTAVTVAAARRSRRWRGSPCVPRGTASRQVSRSGASARSTWSWPGRWSSSVTGSATTRAGTSTGRIAAATELSPHWATSPCGSPGRTS
ncbi:hypothetical protein SAMN05216184_102173 [Georgenia satyanarayanai]|uniref:Transcriptional regulator, AbiEi antitoxin, Type IV TA system n=1 Tax=Georgenia satyanarayanai TaxID=860221 RepID=A0A2Y9C4A0_9MICO|nr:hypothetical protein A8987_102173 [Georgenia satyanarayanai]SSA39253.1 hypothetical protein SAMN05216184_102173 [Georgenia satyanarayanai]